MNKSFNRFMMLSLVFVMLLAGLAMAGETTLSGKIMAEGTFLANDGQAFAISGEKVQELNQNIGKLIEIKGMVQEQEGKSTITITQYKLLETPASKAEAPLTDSVKEKPAAPKE